MVGHHSPSDDTLLTNVRIRFFVRDGRRVLTPQCAAPQAKARTRPYQPQRNYLAAFRLCVRRALRTHS